MKLPCIFFLLVTMITPGFADKIAPPESNCDNGFSSTLDLPSKSVGCYNYQLTVSYDGTGKDELSKMAIKIPCGTVSKASNDRGWTTEAVLTDSGYYSIEVTDITGFGGTATTDSFVLSFSACPADFTCSCDLANLTTEVQYHAQKGNAVEIKEKKENPKKGGTSSPVYDGTSGNECIEYETVSVNAPLACTPAEAELSTADSATTADFCPGSTVDLYITVTQNEAAPWLVVYTDGVNNYEVSVATSPYVLTVSDTGNYSLVSVIDADGFDGIVSGSVALNHFEIPTAQLSGGQTVCSGETAPLTIDLSGTAPWVVSYSDGTQNYEVTTSDTSYIFEASEGTYELLSVTDANCAGITSGTATITAVAPPTAVISGGGIICKKDFATIYFEVTGTSPWTVTYTDEKTVFQKEITSAIDSIVTDQEGTYTLVDVKDANCVGTVSGSATVSYPEPLTGTIYIKDEYCPNTKIYLSSPVIDSNYTYQWSTTGTGALVNATGTKISYATTNEDAKEKIDFTLLVDDGCSITEFNAKTKVTEVYADYTLSPLDVDGLLNLNLEYTFKADMRNADSYYWNFNEGTTASTMDVSYLFLVEGLYNISLSVSKNGCPAKVLKQFEVVSDLLTTEETVYVSNTGSEVKVYGDNISPDNFSFAIYDQYGTQIYQTSNLIEAQQVGWSDHDLYQNSILTYNLEGRFIGGESFVEQGRIMVN